MKYFPRNSKSTAQTWGLFADITMQSQAETLMPDSSVKNTLEIISSENNGRIQPEGFNLRGYDYVSEQNKDRGKPKRDRQTVSLIEGFLGEGEPTLGTISTNFLPNEEEGYGAVEAQREMDIGLSMLVSMRPEILSAHGHDIYWMLYGALQGRASAVQRLEELFGKRPDLKTLLIDLLDAGAGLLQSSIEDLLREEGHEVFRTGSDKETLSV